MYSAFSREARLYISRSYTVGNIQIITKVKNLDMDGQHSYPLKIAGKRKMADVPILINFIVLAIIYVGIVIYAIQNGQVTNGFTYLHNMIKRGYDLDSTARVALEILNEIDQASHVILSFIFLAVLWSISTIVIVRKLTSLVIYIGIICEVILLLALLVYTIVVSQAPMYKSSNSRPYLFFPLFLCFGILKVLAFKEVGLQFLTNILRVSCRVITSYWSGFLIMFSIHISALSSILFGFYVFLQLLSTSLKPIYSEVQNEEENSLEISNFIIISIPIYVYFFHTVNIIFIAWLHNTLWYLGSVILSRFFVQLYQNPDEDCNSLKLIIGRSRTIIRYHVGTVIYAASPCAFIHQILAMWKYTLNTSNEYLRQRPFIGSLSWLVTFYNLPETGLVFCSFYRTAFKESAKLVGKIFMHNPIRLLTIYTILGWLSLFSVAFVSVATLTVFKIYTELTVEQPWASTAAVLITIGAVAMTRTVCQLFRVAVLSIYVFMVQNIQQISNIENKKLVNPAIEKVAQCHDYI